MNIKKGQLYIVLETFRKVGATLYKNQTFEILDLDPDYDSIRVDMIVRDVMARPKDGAYADRWSLNSEIINKYCKLIVKPGNEKEETKEIIVKTLIKRYNKKEFKTILENTK